MMQIYVTLTNTSVAVCMRHVHMGLADGRGWSFYEQREREDDWPCYFAEVETFWHEINGQRYFSRALHDTLLTEATTAAGYREIVKRAYGNLRGVKFGTETEQGNADHDPDRPARLVADHLISKAEAKEACCCMIGCNGCCTTCHNSCLACDGVGQLDHGAGPTCTACNGTGEAIRVAKS